jgi:RHS repeat-associated protein
VQTGKYYYYMSDQINSNRIVTDDTGTIVHSSAHGPYGEIQKTWINTYDPKLKFSGKEREAYSGLDYFGARYYDQNRYRFISVDPIINKEEAFVNPQLWNLYAYCRNNPIKYFDPTGMISESMGKYEYTVADHLGKASNDPVSRFIAAELATGYIMGGSIAALLKALKWGVRAYRTSSYLARTTKLGAKIFKQMGKRGWNKNKILKLIKKPFQTVKTRDTRWVNRSKRLDDPATAFIDKNGHYVVRNDITGDIV